MGTFHETYWDGPSSLMGKEKRQKDKVWGEVRHLAFLRMACLLVLSPVILVVVEGASLSLEHSEGQLAPRFYEQMERHHYRPEQRQQFNGEGGNGNHGRGNRNLMNLRGKFGGGVGREEEELLEQDSVGGRSRVHNNDDGDNGNDEIIKIAASEVVPRRLQAVELLMEKYKQLENVKEEVEEREKQDELEEEEQESATGKEPEVQFKSEHHYHQHQRQHHNHPPRMMAVPIKEGQEEEEDGAMNGGRGRGPGRALWSEDFDKKALELCGTSASLQCGKRVQSLIEGQTELSVHMKCDLRDDFLKCIDTQKRECLATTVLPQLPPKDVIKVEQSKLWKILWTAGGCVLAD